MSSSPIRVDPYGALGVLKNIGLTAIETARRKLVLEYQPDRIKDPTAREESRDVFHKVQTPYEILSDDNRGNRYDQEVQADTSTSRQQYEETPVGAESTKDMEN
ncbi:MAG: hypothetical protein Q9160_003903 [Pyrenula sp. 1 TL-2023]